jgi:enoyl-CoA hydratase/carnithine racemase
MDGYEFLLVGDQERVRTITLNRPDKLNALNSGMMNELKRALVQADTDEEIACVVLKGAGNAFSTGADIQEFKDRNDEAAIRARAELTSEVHLLFRQIQVPVIAAVHQYAYAGGCGIALACDLVVAAEDAVFAYPEIQRGFVPAIVCANLIRIAGRRHAFDMLVTGRKIRAQEALAMNLVNQVVPRDQLDRVVSEMARQIAGYSRSALRMTKRLFYETAETDFESAIALARDMNIRMRQTSDFKKGVDTFLGEKRR